MKVSVLIITYNQERFIEQAVRSALTQQTTFPFEVVVGEDRSTDGTREVLNGIRDDRMELLFRERNLGMQPNYADTLDHCSGEFVAVLEGDDYWTDSLKLQKQVDFFTAHPECSTCFHQAVIVDSEGHSKNEVRPHEPVPEITSTQDILKTEYIPNPTVMYRRSAVPQLPTWFMSMKLGDWPLHVLLSLKGAIGYIPQPMAAYRMHAAGMWSQLKERQRLANEIEMYRHLLGELPAEYQDLAKFSLAERLYDLATNHAREGELDDAKRVFDEALSLQSDGYRFPPRRLARMRMRLMPTFNRISGAVRKAKQK